MRRGACPRDPAIRERWGISGSISLLLHARDHSYRLSPSRPARKRRQRGEDGFDIAAGPEAEHAAAVVEQVELGVTTAADELLVAIGLAPEQREVVPDDLRIDTQEGATDVLREGERRVPAPLGLR